MSFRLITRRWILFAMLILTLGWQVSTSNSNWPGDHKSLSRLVDLDVAINDSVIALKRLEKNDGRFVYRLDMKSGYVYPDYSIIRHGGVVYALASAATDVPSAQNREILSRAINFVLRSSLERKALHGESFALVVPNPSIELQKPPRFGSLGASALNLISMLTSEKIFPGLIDVEVVRQLGRFLIIMQRPDGKFYGSYLVDEDLLSELHDSPFYMGESLLALILIYEWDRGPHRAKWLQSAQRGFEYLIRSQDPENPRLDNWSIIAFGELLRSGGSLGPIALNQIYRYTLRIINAEIKSQMLNASDPRTAGCYGPHAEITETATRLEGILAGFRFLPRQVTFLNPQMMGSIKQAILCMLKAQSGDGPYRGLFSERPIPSEMRMDYTQHALMALLAYRNLGLTLEN